MFAAHFFPESPNGFTPRLNISHVQNGVYRTIGRMMSTIIVQGGEAPAFLSPPVVDYIMTGNIHEVHVTPDDLANPELREALKKELLVFHSHVIKHTIIYALLLCSITAL